MSDLLDPEEVAALAVLDALGRSEGPEETSVPEPEDEIEEVLRRLFGEAIGLLPYALEPVEPRAALKSQLLMLAVGDTTQEVEPIPGQARAPSSSAQRVAAAATKALAPVPVAGKANRRWLARAAALLLTLGGAGLWLAYLHSELQAERSRRAWTEREWKGQALTAQATTRELERRLQFVTSPAATVFHLRCPSGRGPAAAAHGLVWVAADQKGWDLELRGMAPEPAGREYQLWFLVGDQARSGGCFSIRDGRALFTAPGAVPPGATGIGVTLEPKGGSTRPTSPLLLVSNEPIRL